ncbi:MAG: dipeptidase [Candidatus Cohnella colombiensis]|uniref:Dipeptidase n=1 Tax=Candidatus Cohnella colombiensis TaxID=3121368 RepID=A0AA95F036_9BACL|nr:MAG: dipeptidase [Cohnella sp.]
MRVVDLHADVLYKMLTNPEVKWVASGSEKVFDTTPARLSEGNVGLQVFPIYIPEHMPHTPETLFRTVELFWSEVLTVPDVMLVRTREELELAWQSGKLGAMLSLEGAGAIQGQLWVLQLLHRLGLRLLGPTWNHANWACDGAMEPRGGGLTKAGVQLIKECESLGIIIDVSHLSVRGFWDVAELTTRPFIASHSNVRQLKEHPRNLSDEQIKVIIQRQGIIGVTFVPTFLKNKEQTTIDDVLRHVEAICQLGGVNHVAFGSDFDGVDRYPQGLEHPGKYPVLVNALLQHYPEQVVRGFIADNAIRFLHKNLIN